MWVTIPYQKCFKEVLKDVVFQRYLVFSLKPYATTVIACENVEFAPNWMMAPL